MKKIDMERSLERLPTEIITNILSRLPLRSVFISRSVCKTWCSLINHPLFPELHLSSIISNNTQSSSIILHAELDDNKSISRDSYMIEHDPIPASCSKIHVPLPNKTLIISGSSGGLICFSSAGGLGDSPGSDEEDDGYFNWRDCLVYLWNPFIRECVKLPDLLETQPALPALVDGYYVLKINSGFGFVPSTKQFKLLHVVSWIRGIIVTYEAYVHTVGAMPNSWRKVENVPIEFCLRRPQGDPFTLSNSSLHALIVTDGDEDGDGDANVEDLNLQIQISAFDLEHERFGAFPSPNFTIDATTMCYLDDCPFALGELKSCLSLLDHSLGDRYEIWIMKEYNVAESWVKQFVVTRDLIRGARVLDIVCMTKNDELVLLCAYGFLISYNFETGEYTRLTTPLRNSFMHKCQAVSCVGTLISPKLVCNREQS